MPVDRDAAATATAVAGATTFFTGVAMSTVDPVTGFAIAATGLGAMTAAGSTRRERRRADAAANQEIAAEHEKAAGHASAAAQQRAELQRRVAAARRELRAAEEMLQQRVEVARHEQRMAEEQRRSAQQQAALAAAAAEAAAGRAAEAEAQVSQLTRRVEGAESNAASLQRQASTLRWVVGTAAVAATGYAVYVYLRRRRAPTAAPVAGVPVPVGVAAEAMGVALDQPEAEEESWLEAQGRAGVEEGEADARADLLAHALAERWALQGGEAPEGDEAIARRLQGEAPAHGSEARPRMDGAEKDATAFV